MSFPLRDDYQPEDTINHNLSFIHVSNQRFDKGFISGRRPDLLQGEASAQGCIHGERRAHNHYSIIKRMENPTQTTAGPSLNVFHYGKGNYMLFSYTCIQSYNRIQRLGKRNTFLLQIQEVHITFRTLSGVLR